MKEAIRLLAHTLGGELHRFAEAGFEVIDRVRAEDLPAAAADATVPAVAEAPAPEGPAALATSTTASAPPPAAEPAPGLSLEALLQRPGPAAQRLQVLQDDVIGACERCKLHRGRNKLVFGVGNPDADLVFVGEGPGAEEDRQGIPFVGRAGALLTKMIEAMGYTRDDVYICNVVKCRPPNNRDPEPDEVEACEPFLKAQLTLTNPKVIVTLGRVAAQTLLRTKTSMGRMHGQWTTYAGVDLLPTFHPAYLLRSPDKKREAWADLKKVMDRLKTDG